MAVSKIRVGHLLEGSAKVERLCFASGERDPLFQGFIDETEGVRVVSRLERLQREDEGIVTCARFFGKSRVGFYKADVSIPLWQVIREAHVSGKHRSMRQRRCEVAA